MTGDRTIFLKVAHALAEADGVEPTSLGYTLAEYIDPSGLETLVSMENGSGKFTFEVPDHEVTVTDAREVFVDGKRYQSHRDTLDTQKTRILSFPEEHPHFQRLVDTLPGMVYECRNQQEWPMDFVSKGSIELTGYDPDTFIENGVSYGTDIIHPDDRTSVWDAVQQSLQNEEPFSITYRIQTADNTQKWVWENGTGVVENGEHVALVGYITDITDHKEESWHPQKT